MNEFENVGLVLGNNNNPLPENVPAEQNNTYSKWTYQEQSHHNNSYGKNVVGNTNALPQLKVTDSTNFSRLQLFELLFTTKYIEDVIITNINKNIIGETKTSLAIELHIVNF